MQVRTFRRFSVGVLVYTVAAIIWGAFVRASASGDGCGDHWPLCQGSVLPSGSIKTLIEFTHRATTGLLGLGIVALTVSAFQTFPRGHVVRRAAVGTFIALILEAAAGAALVKFGWVAANHSPMRGVAVSIHLVVTFFLLATVTLTAFWSYEQASPAWRGQGAIRGLLCLGFVGLVLLGVTGAITALGDSLFPASSLAAGLLQDASESAHLFVRLRIWHPLLALLMAAYVTAASMWIAGLRPTRAVKRTSVALVGLVIMQLAAGATNLLLLAPIWMQLIHLLLADGVWIAFVMLAAGALERRAMPSPHVIEAAAQ
jgi:cytochrome c oxidase assembly protein subunit 15